MYERVSLFRTGDSVSIVRWGSCYHGRFFFYTCISVSQFPLDFMFSVVLLVIILGCHRCLTEYLLPYMG